MLERLLKRWPNASVQMYRGQVVLAMVQSKGISVPDGWLCESYTTHLNMVYRAPEMPFNELAAADVFSWCGLTYIKLTADSAMHLTSGQVRNFTNEMPCSVVM